MVGEKKKMKKPIERASSEKQGRVQQGIPSETFGRFASTDQMQAWKDQIDSEHYEDFKLGYREVRLPNDRDKRKELDELQKELSGDVVVRKISDLPEEERKRYEK